MQAVKGINMGAKQRKRKGRRLMYLIKTIDEGLHARIHCGDRPGRFILGLGPAADGAGVAAAATRRRGWPGRWFLQRGLILRHVP